MHATYRNHTIQIIREPSEAYFIVRYPNGTKMTSGFFKLNDSLVQKYREIRNRIDMELSQ